MTAAQSSVHHSNVTAQVNVRWLRRPHCVVVALLRLVLVLAALGISGLAPAVADLIACDEVHDAASCSDCPLEQDGRDCPPGCPSCHCVHAGIGLPPVDALHVATLDRDVEAAAIPYEAAVPRAPPASDVYRPPRGSLTVAS